MCDRHSRRETGFTLSLMCRGGNSGRRSEGTAAAEGGATQATQLLWYGKSRNDGETDGEIIPGLTICIILIMFSTSQLSHLLHSPSSPVIRDVIRYKGNLISSSSRTCQQRDKHTVLRLLQRSAAGRHQRAVFPQRKGGACRRKRSQGPCRRLPWAPEQNDR